MTQPFYARLEQETQAHKQYLYAAPVLARLSSGAFSRAHYERFLVNAYHHVKHTVRLMMACGAELPERLQWMQRSLIAYMEEEVGHEAWVLNDLAACGASPEAVAEAPPSWPVEQMVRYVYDVIRRGNPVGFFGMVYVLEGTSTAIATHAADVIQKQLALPDKAFSYLRSHGELDQDHVRFFEELVNRLEDADDQQAVIEVAQRVFYLYGDVIRDADNVAVHHAA